jgi:hypothetical protein
MTGAMLKATSITYVTSTPTFSSPAQGDYPESLTFPQFDPSGGSILSGLTLTLTAITSLTVEGQNPLATPASFSYGSDTTVGIPYLSPFLPFDGLLFVY